MLRTLDTNICSYILRRHPASMIERFAALNPDQEYLDEGYYFFVTGNPNGDHPGEYFYAKTADEHHQNCIIAGWG